MKKLLAILALSMFLNQIALADAFLIQQPQMTQGQYLAGGLTSLFVGWGVGHAIQGRYAERGWIFTLGEAASFGMFFGGYGWAAANIISHTERSSRSNFDTRNSIPNMGGPASLMVAGGIAFTAIRIWEVIDAFAAPYSDSRPYYGAIEKPVASTKLAFVPWVAPNSAGFLMQF